MYRYGIGQGNSISSLLRNTYYNTKLCTCNFKILGTLGQSPSPPQYFVYFPSSLSRLRQRSCGINPPHKFILFSLNFSLNFLTYSRDCGFNPHSPHFIFFLYFCSNFLIYSIGCGFNPHTHHFMFLLNLSSIHEVMGSIPTQNLI